MIYLFFLSIFLIILHFLLYPLIISLKKKEGKRDNTLKNYFPYVSYIIPAHNEEKIIEKKIRNVFSLDYPKERMEVIVANDHSTDETVNIVKKLMAEFKELKLIDTKRRGGKVNAQNEAVKMSKGEIIAFSDANTMWDRNSLKKLIFCLNEKGISCACGKIIYTNVEESEVSSSEGLYWKLENKLKELESNFCSLTAINGGIYAIRREDYMFLNPMFSHDIAFPILLAKKKKRTIFCKNALAFERSGTTIKDEWKRKTRMFGRIYYFIFKNLPLLLNPFFYNLKFYFSLFSHRIVRYTLPLWHTLLFISSAFLIREGIIFSLFFHLQILFMIFSLLGYFFGKKIKILNLFLYYTIFILSMIVGFVNFVTGRVKPYWEIAKTTREGVI